MLGYRGGDEARENRSTIKDHAMQIKLLKNSDCLPMFSKCTCVRVKSVDVAREREKEARYGESKERVKER